MAVSNAHLNKGEMKEIRSDVAFSGSGLPLLCSHKGFVSTPQSLSALVIQFAVDC